jgi:hypothetical protein
MHHNPRKLSSWDKVLPQGFCDSLGSVMNTELGLHLLQVAASCLLAKAEFLGGLSELRPGREQPQYCQFSRRQLVSDPSMFGSGSTSWSSRSAAKLIAAQITTRVGRVMILAPCARPPLDNHRDACHRPALLAVRQTTQHPLGIAAKHRESRTWQRAFHAGESTALFIPMERLQGMVATPAASPH